MARIDEFPEGPVTVMFTDIEASTALRTSLGDAAADALLGRHGDLVRQQIELHRGHDLQAALGDGFLAVFASTRRAIACAVGIQQEMDRFNRVQLGTPMRIRIGLNTGEVAWQNDQPSGEAVHAASRVCAAAGGGEVLVSDITRQLAGTVPDVSFSDRGEFDLKGFPQPWRLWSLSWHPTALDAPREVFVGRDAELGELRKHLLAALDGNGGLVLVGGEPGVGKTSLVKQLVKDAEQRGAVALFGRCYESEGTVPYSPFVETTEQALHLIPAEWVREDLGDDAAEVARMVPELRRRFPDIGEPLELPPEQQRRYFFNAISKFLNRAAARAPLVLVADDAHWADEPTLLLIEHVASQLRDLRILAIGTYRDVELDVSRPLAATIERLLRSRTAARLSVKRFDKAGVARMLEAHAGRPAPDALVDTIFGETEGNPFFVDEVFRHLVEEGKVFDDSGAFRSAVAISELDVPESIRLVVGRRIERLGTDAQRVLAAAAVVGRGFEFGLLEHVVDVDTNTLLDVFDEAERARVIVPEERGGKVFYTFGHELIRQTLLASLSVPRRQRLHLAVANAMELVDPSAAELRPSEIAQHLLEAGAAAEPSRTVDYLKRTAGRALEAAAFEEAVRATEAALSLLGESADERARFELIETLGWAERALGRFERCIDLWDGVVEAYARLGEIDKAGKLLWQIGYQLIWLGRFDDAFATYARGIEILGDRPIVSRADILGSVATLTAFAGSLEVSESLFAEALQVAEAVGDDACIGRIWWGRCVASWSGAQVAAAIEAGRKAVSHLRRGEDMWTLVDALAWLSFPLAMSGIADEARRFAVEAVELGLKLGHNAGELLGDRGVVLAGTLTGHTVDDLLRHATRDLLRMQAINSPWISQSHAWLSAAYSVAGSLDEGLAQADAAIGTEPESAWTGVGWAYRFLNRAYARDTHVCREMIDSTMANLVGSTDTTTMGTAMMIACAAEGCAMLGWSAEAEQLYPRIAVLAGAMPLRVFDVASMQRIAGMTAATLERWDQAQAHFSTALEQVESMPNAFDDPIVRHRYAEMLVRRGGPADRGAARALVDAAIKGYSRLGMSLLLAQAEELYRSLR